MKKILNIIIVLLVIFNINVYASTNTLPRDENNLDVWDNINTQKYKNDILRTPNVDETEKIYDFADLFTDDEEKDLFDRVSDYIEKNNLDLVILTIDQNDKSTAQRYAEDFYIYNYFGFEGAKRSGSILIIDMDTREAYIATSGSAILYYDDARIENMLDDIFEYLPDGEYYNSALAFINDVNNYGTSIPSSNSHYEIDGNGNYVKKKSVNWIIALLGANVIPLIFFLTEKRKYKGIVKATRANEYIEKENIVKGKSTDKFLSTFTNRTKIYHDSGSSGGSHGGGSSTHIGGGGHSFGGGGRHF